MKPTLQLRISQQLTLTPQLQQAIRLLQLSTQDMHQEVARMLEENPMLEMAEESATTIFTPDSSLVSRSSSNESESGSDDRGNEEQRNEDRGTDDFGPD